jgi:hypothetical protein
MIFDHFAIVPDQGRRIQFGEDTLFWEERWICLFSEEGRSAYFGTKMAPCCGGQIRNLNTQLLDPVVKQSAQISYKLCMLVIRYSVFP